MLPEMCGSPHCWVECKKFAIDPANGLFRQIWSCTSTPIANSCNYEILADISRSKMALCVGLMVLHMMLLPKVETALQGKRRGSPVFHIERPPGPAPRI
jgi:hypothetical protein